jgi:hypothetical protein
MKKFKSADLLISILLIVIAVVYAIIKRNQTAFAGYFVVGAWQVISMLLHYKKQLFTQTGGSRSNYHKCILAIALFTAILLLAAKLTEWMLLPLLLFLAFLLFTAPVLAIYYAWLCYNETYVKMRRPMYFLK